MLRTFISPNLSAISLKGTATAIISVLVDFLSKILTQTHINNVLYCKVTFSQLNETSLSAQLVGVPVDSFDEDVKSVTYHEVDVKKNDKGLYETVIIFDI